MTVLDESLHSYLTTYSGLTALVSTKVYPFKMPEGVTLPCVTFQRIDTPIDTVDDAEAHRQDFAHFTRSRRRLDPESGGSLGPLDDTNENAVTKGPQPANVDVAFDHGSAHANPFKSSP